MEYAVLLSVLGISIALKARYVTGGYALMGYAVDKTMIAENLRFVRTLAVSPVNVLRIKIVVFVRSVLRVAVSDLNVARIVTVHQGVSVIKAAVSRAVEKTQIAMISSRFVSRTPVCQ